jgi:hypothetical protein
VHDGSFERNPYCLVLKCCRRNGKLTTFSGSDDGMVNRCPPRSKFTALKTAHTVLQTHYLILLSVRVVYISVEETSTIYKRIPCLPTSYVEQRHEIVTTDVIFNNTF